jgi:hypothetical protein
VFDPVRVTGGNDAGVRHHEDTSGAQPERQPANFFNGINAEYQAGARLVIEAREQQNVSLHVRKQTVGGGSVFNRI